MGVFDQGYKQAIIDASRLPIERPPAGFLEAFSATWESTRQEDLTISESLNLGRHRRKRLELVKELAGEDIGSLEGPAETLQALAPSSLLPVQRETINRYREKIRELSARFPEIRTDEEILTDIIEESRRIRERTGKVLEHTTFGGKIGSFTGAMAASLTDPLLLSTIPFGASVSAGILRTALIEAGIGALTEAAAQPFIWRYKKQLESPYSLEEAFERVAAAGVGAGVFAGVIKGGVVAGKKIVTRLRKPRIEGIDDLIEAFEANVIDPTILQHDAARVLGEWADVLRENPFELGNPVAEMRHVEATAKAIADVEAGRPVEVRDIVRDLEPRPEVRGRAEPTPQAEVPARFVWPGHESLVHKSTVGKPWRVTEFAVQPDGALKPIRHDIFDTYEEAIADQASNLNRRRVDLVAEPARLTATAIEAYVPVEEPPTRTKGINAGKVMQKIEKGEALSPDEYTFAIDELYLSTPTRQTLKIKGGVKLSEKAKLESAAGVDNEFDALQRMSREAVVFSPREELGAGLYRDLVEKGLAEEKTLKGGYIEFKITKEGNSLRQEIGSALAKGEIEPETLLRGELPGEGRLDIRRGGGEVSPSPPKIEREWERWAAAEEAQYLVELEGKAKSILDVEDVEVPLVAVERQGELVPLAGREAAGAIERGEGIVIQRSAREMIAEAADDVKAGNILTKCLSGG